jgi:hypothetical protein
MGSDRQTKLKIGFSLCSKSGFQPFEVYTLYFYLSHIFKFQISNFKNNSDLMSSSCLSSQTSSLSSCWTSPRKKTRRYCGFYVDPSKLKKIQIDDGTIRVINGTKTYGKGIGVFCDVDISPWQEICDYVDIIKNARLTSKKKVDNLTACGFNKIMRVYDSNIWWNGEYSNTVGPSMNHACNCVSNVQVIFDPSRGMMPVMTAKNNIIKAGTELTFDYGILYELQNVHDQSLYYYRDYLCPNGSNHRTDIELQRILQNVK